VTDTWRTTRCEDCGDEIDIDSDGWRTLCACDAAE
jgi:hypothetical protein